MAPGQGRDQAQDMHSYNGHHMNTVTGQHTTPTGHASTWGGQSSAAWGGQFNEHHPVNSFSERTPFNGFSGHHGHNGQHSYNGQNSYSGQNSHTGQNSYDRHCTSSGYMFNNQSSTYNQSAVSYTPYNGHNAHTGQPHLQFSGHPTGQHTQYSQAKKVTNNDNLSTLHNIIIIFLLISLVIGLNTHPLTTTTPTTTPLFYRTTTNNIAITPDCLSKDANWNFV